VNRRIAIALYSALLFLSLGVFMPGIIPAFVGAEGYGAGTVGGRGGQVVHVTNLNDEGVGSLRWALEQVKGPRTIVFDVNGTITLSRQILIEDGFVTIAGQTAPGNGIVIEGSRIRVDASEVIIRGLIFRPGDGSVGMEPGDRDGLFIGSTDNVVNNVIVDHNSFEWSVDQNLAATGRVQNITFSNNIIAQGLHDSIHPKGAHSKGAGTGPWSTGEWNANNHISFIKNLMASNFERNPEIGSGDHIEMINNYVFNYGMSDKGSTFGSNSKTVAYDLKLNAIGNVYQAGLDTPGGTRGPIYLGNLGSGSTVYLADNLVMGRAVDADGNQSQSGMYWSETKSTWAVKGQPGFTGSGTLILDSQQVVAYVLANAGARPYDRDEVDARIIAGVANGTLRLVDSVADAGGKAANPPVAAPADTDRDGMPDWFEDKYGFNKLVADDKGDSDGDGYTNLEEYLNGLFTGFDLGTKGTDGPAQPPVSSSPPPVQTAPPVTAPPPAATPAPSPAPTPAPESLKYVHGTAKNDTLTIRNASERAVEKADGGIDLVVAYVDYVLGDHLENLSLKPGATKGTGNELANQISGTVNNDVLDGKAGDDKLYGHAGDDHLVGGAGNDWVEGGGGNDRLVGGTGADVLFGGAGVDTFVLETGGSNATSRGTDDRITDFTPGDRIEVNGKVLDLTALPQSDKIASSYANAFAAAQGMTAKGAEYAIVHGTRDSWLFWDGNKDGQVDSGVTLSLASALRDKWSGPGAATAGTTSSLSSAPASTAPAVQAPAASVPASVSQDAQRLFGTAANDVFSIRTAGVEAVEQAGGGIDSVVAYVDYTLGEHIENLSLKAGATKGIGNDLNNQIDGSTGDDLLDGKGGDDRLRGGDGNDELFGGAGKDWVEGNAGNDRLDGGSGADVLFGGAGNDTFIFASGETLADALSAQDRITDFGPGDLIVVDGQVLDLAGLPDLHIAGANYAKAFAAAEKMTASGAEFALIHGSKDSWLFWDADGDGSIDNGVTLSLAALTRESWSGLESVML
jgi:Ca2+-binding RTX toxin-like protein